MVVVRVLVAVVVSSSRGSSSWGRFAKNFMMAQRSAPRLECTITISRIKEEAPAYVSIIMCVCSL